MAGVRAICVAWLVLACRAGGSDFREQLQTMLNEQVLFAKLVLKLDVAIQIGWKSKNESFGVAAGKIANSSRKVTADDTFLYGSGTKSVTAAAVMRLADEKKISWSDKASKYIDPFMQRNNGTTMERLFSKAVANATVLDVIRMAAGIPDFELPNSGGKRADPCDTEVLTHPDRVYPPYFWIRYASNTTKGQPQCAPSTCTAYSSTSYEVAGLLLTALQHPEGDWTDLDMRTMAMPNPNSSYPSLTFMGGKAKHISEALTVPGIVTNHLWPQVPIFDQNPSILGWTCGNMVGATKDVAAWFYDLLDPDTANPKIVSDAARAEMMRLETLTAGWAKGYLKYGAGLMENKVSRTTKGPDDWGYSIGHEGQTFGFYSANGYIPKAKAGFSFAINTDGAGLLTMAVVCHMMQIAAKASGDLVNLNCPVWEDLKAQYESPAAVIV